MDAYSSNSSEAPGSLDDENIQHILDDFKTTLLTVQEPLTIALICFYVPVFVLALVGNVLVLVIITPHRQMWSVTNNFLVNLAIADLLVTVVCIPMTIAEKVYRLWIFGDVLCKATPFLQGVSVTASTLTITGMSVDRCLAIYYPMKMRRVRTTSHVRVIITLIWIIAIALLIPILFVRGLQSQVFGPGVTITYCIEVWINITQRQIYDVSLLCVIYVIPGFIVSISYIIMGRKLWAPDKHLETSSLRNNRKSLNLSMRNVQKNRRKMAKMCISVAIVFATCWLPYYILNTYLDFTANKVVANGMHFTLMLGHLHSATNPFLYCFWNKSYRKCMKRSLKSCCRRRLPDTSPVPQSSPGHTFSRRRKTTFTSAGSLKYITMKVLKHLSTEDENNMEGCEVIANTDSRLIVEAIAPQSADSSPVKPHLPNGVNIVCRKSTLIISNPAVVPPEAGTPPRPCAILFRVPTTISEHTTPVDSINGYNMVEL